MKKIALSLVFVIAVMALVACSSGTKSLDNTQWKLTSSSSDQIDAEAVEVTLSFESGRVSGNGGVNNYFGDYTADAKTGKLTIGSIGATLMAGPEVNMKTENAYLKLLEKVTTYTNDGSKLVLMDKDKTEILTFAKK